MAQSKNRDGPGRDAQAKELLAAYFLCALCAIREPTRAVRFGSWRRPSAGSRESESGVLRSREWFFFLRAEDMYRLKSEWFSETSDGWFCDLEVTKADRPKHRTTVFFYDCRCSAHLILKYLD